LIERLCSEGFEVLVETGGFVSTEGVDSRASIILDVKCPASGEEPRNHWPNLERLRADKDEVKFVITNFADWRYALEIIKRYELSKRARAFLFHPPGMRWISKTWLSGLSGSGLDLRMQLQLHKYIWGRRQGGV